MWNQWIFIYNFKLDPEQLQKNATTSLRQEFEPAALRIYKLVRHTCAVKSSSCCCFHISSSRAVWYSAIILGSLFTGSLFVGSLFLESSFRGLVGDLRCGRSALDKAWNKNIYSLKDLKFPCNVYFRTFMISWRSLPQSHSYEHASVHEIPVQDLLVPTQHSTLQSASYGDNKHLFKDTEGETVGRKSMGTSLIYRTLNIQ